MNAVTAFQKKGKLNRDTVKRVSEESILSNKNKFLLMLIRSVSLLCHQLSIAIEAAKKDSSTSSTVLSLARSSVTTSSPRESVQMDRLGEQPAGDPVMTEVQECCPCWMKRCTCDCIAMWKASSGYRAWRSMRHKIKKLVEHRYFEWGILGIIVASSVTLVSGYGQWFSISLKTKPLVDCRPSTFPLVNGRHHHSYI